MGMTEERNPAVLSTSAEAQKTAGSCVTFGDERWKLAVEGARAGIWDWNAETDEVYYSRRWKEILGFDENEIGSTRSEWEDRIHPEDRLATLAALNAHLEGESPLYETEYRLKRKDGAWQWVHASGTVVSRDANGKALRFLGTQSDIAARKQAEEALRQSEAKFRAIVDNSHDGILFTDAEGIILLRSPSSRLVNGYTDEERVGRRLFEKIHPEDLAPVREAWATLVSHPEFVQEFHCRIRHKDGTWRWLESSAQNLLDNVNVQAIVVTSRDVTQRKRAEEALQRSLQEYFTLAKCIPDTIWTMDLSGRFTYLSPNVERSHGWTVEECLKLDRRQVCTPQQVAKDDVLLEQELEAAASPGYDRNRNIRLESEQRRKDGSIFWAEINASFLWSEDGKPIGVTGVTRDITERKRAEAEREKLWAHLAQVQKTESIGRLAGGVAHDFNNLLTVINGYSKLALGKMRAGDPLREQLQEIHKAGERAASLTQQLLAFSRKQVLQPRVLDLNRVVDEMQSMLGRLVGEDVELEFRPNPESPTVRADPHQLEQVIMNLAVNARDAMPHGGKLRIETAIVELDKKQAGLPPETPAGRYAVLAVSDTGVGMDPATRQRIFEPFFTTKGHGTGLGLSTVQGIVTQSSGYIDVHSEPGQGTTFKIHLPALAAARVETERPARSRELRGRETVLVVEDQSEVRQYAVEALKAYGYRVIQAASASEACVLFEREQTHIGLVLTDVVMPHTNGRELLVRLTQMRPGIKVLVMSGYAGNVAVPEGLPFIEKPFSPEDVAAKVREVLGPPLTAARILVADDEAGVRSFLREVLEQDRYEVLEAVDGKEAHSLAGQVDLVITDLVMPEQEGIETIRALRREVPGVGIIATSGAFGGLFLKAAKTLGADAVLAKPVTPELLLAKVAEVLTMRR